MAQVKMNPRAAHRFFLKSGAYGPGLDHEAECEIMEYQYPAEERPGWDQQEKTQIGDFAFLKIRVRTGDGVAQIWHHEPISENSGSRLPGWLVSLGVTLSDDGNYSHDTDDVVGKSCGVQMGDPRQDKNDSGKYYTGNLLQIYGV